VRKDAKQMVVWLQINSLKNQKADSDCTYCSLINAHNQQFIMIPQAHLH
jgi:hypothetical protein